MAFSQIFLELKLQGIQGFLHDSNCDTKFGAGCSHQMSLPSRSADRYISLAKPYSVPLFLTSRKLSVMVLSNRRERDEVESDDDETTVFDLFLVWLYQDHQAISNPEVDLSILVKLYVLADMWCVPHLMDEIMRALIAKGNRNERFDNYQVVLLEISGALEQYWVDTAHLPKLSKFLKLWTIYVVDGCQSQNQAYAEAVLRKICEASPDFSTELLLTYSRERVHGWWERSWEHENMLVSET